MLSASRVLQGVGVALWLGAPWVPVGVPPAPGSLAHVFLFLPLVGAPLALALLARLLGEPGRSGWARRLQPVAALLVLASFCCPPGPLAGALAASWLALAVGLAVGDVGRAARVSASLVAALVCLVVGAGWLVAARLGVGPRGFSALTVLLAAVHFHFSGFVLQLVFAATGRALAGRSGQRWARRLAVGALVALVLIAAGNLAGAAPLKLAGVLAMVACTLGLGGLTIAVARHAGSAWLYVSSASLAAAMVVAGVYGLGEATGRSLIELSTMVTAHGALQTLGFLLFGLVGHLRLAGAGHPKEDERW